MGSVEAVKKAIAKCDFLIDNEVVSGVDLLQSFLDFLVREISNDNQFYGVALHTGSKVFDAAAIVFAAFTNLVNNSDPQEIIFSLNIGDYVLYQHRRWVFKGKCVHPIDPTKTVVLLEGNEAVKEVGYIPEIKWNQITPYNGASTRKDGRGIHRKDPIREMFYKEVLDYKSNDISDLTDTSSVIIISKGRADIIERISVRFHGKTARLLDLITATYYAENSVLPFGGNIGQNEPILKLTSKASVARKLIKKQDGNEHIGLVITGNNTIGRIFNELEELTALRTLKYILILTQIDSEYGPDLLNLSEDAQLFACTKSFVKKHSLPQCNDTSTIISELRNQMSIISNCESKAQKVSSDITWEQFKEFKQTMILIKRSEYTSSEIENFIMNAYSLMNLFLTSVFSIGELEQQIEKGIVTTVISPSAKLEELEKQRKLFPKALSDYAKKIIEILQSCWIMLADRCEKESALLTLLRQYHDKKIAIIVPKEYYTVVLRSLGIFSVMDFPEYLSVIPANQFDHTLMFDIIISSGLMKGRRFDAFRCRSAKTIITLVYDFEKRLYSAQMKQARAVEELYDSRSEKRTLPDKDISQLESVEENRDNEAASMEDISHELDEYITRLQEKADLRVLTSYSGNNSATAECVASAIFENDDRGFFTKRYKAYVIDKATGEAYEKDVEKLAEGDSLIFTINNANTRDIVDDMLQKLIGSLGEKTQESYRKSKEWKQILKEYTEVVGAKETLRALKRTGIPVQISTIRHWLDPDSHQVGLRAIDSFRAVGLVTGHTEMFEHPEVYYEACADVKRVRGEILKYIGEAIIKKISGIVPKLGDIMAEVYDRLDSSAVVLRIESIREINMEIPINLVNRPITMKE